MEKRDTPGIKLIRLGRNWVTEHMGSKNTTKTVQGQTDSREATKEGGDGREPEQEEPGRIQATAITVAHGGADGERSHGEGMAADSRGPTNSGGAGGRRA